MPFNKFSNANELAKALAIHVAEKLSTAITKKGVANIAVSGGGTPKRFFSELSKQDVQWQKVRVTLVDERWVPDSDERSNAKLVKELLLIERAKNAQFIPLFDAGISYHEISSQGEKFSALLPFDVTILGMGGDGHTASFFPGGDNLDEAVDLNTSKIILDMKAAGAGEPRVTFTLSGLLNAAEVILHIEGEEKMAVLEKAQQTGEANQLPIRHVLNARENLNIFWAP